MKLTFLLTFFTLCASLAVHAQKIEKYYDYNWKETQPKYALYYSEETKTDSGWLRNDYYIKEQRLQMQGLYDRNNDTIKNGNFVFYHPSGHLSSTGKYVNDQKTGLWLGFHDNGMMSDSAMYKNGHPVGVLLGWYANGYPRDSTFYYQDGTGTKLTWYDNGTPSTAGRVADWGKDSIGKWYFFHKNGNKSAIETYNSNGKLTGSQYFDINGNPDPAADGKEHEAKFGDNSNAWIKYLSKNLYAPSQYKLVNTDKAQVIIDFVIDEEGNVQNVRVLHSLHPAYDDIAVNVIKKSPKWVPAKEHNRNVRAYRRQPVTFQQVE